MENETWLPIKKYPGYAVSDLGRIKSMRRTLVLKNGKKHTITEKLLTVKEGPSGSNHVIIHYKGKNYSELVEVLYYQAKK